MQVIIAGAGLSGVASAWFLRQAGHEVLVIDRGEQAATETSYANGGQISASHPEPWSSPAAPRILLRWLGSADAPMRFQPQADPALWRWGLRFLRECAPARFAANAHAIAALAAFSRSTIAALRAQLHLDYEARQAGILHLFARPAEIAALPEKQRLLAAHGIDSECCTPARCVQIEPALSTLAPHLAGGLYAPQDESGNARLFARALAARCQQAGVRFHFQRTIAAVDGQGVTLANEDGTPGERLSADAVVLCAGSFGAALVRPLGLRLPVYPVKGFSISAPVREASLAPTVSLTDESRRIVCSRLGDTVRVAGMADIGGFDRTPHPARIALLRRWLEQTFPGATYSAEAEAWCGLRPVTPSNRPVIGASRVPGLWFNTGHGALGFTLSCGAARLLTALMQGETPPVDPRPFLPASHHV